MHNARMIEVAFLCTVLVLHGAWNRTLHSAGTWTAGEFESAGVLSRGPGWRARAWPLHVARTGARIGL